MTLKVLAIICLMITIARPSPVPPQPDNDVFAEFLKNARSISNPEDSVQVVKRRTVEENSDNNLKQIGLQSVIEDLEQNLFASAASVHSVVNHKDANVPEIKPNNVAQHDVNKRQTLTETKTSTGNETTITESNSDLPAGGKVIVQTTEKIPESSGVPAHIVIDRISIHPHTSNVALIPIFELNHAKKEQDDKKDHEITKITISKTEITSLSNTPAATEVNISTSSTIIPSSTPTTTTIENKEVSTTPGNIDQLKEAEADLKEKVAEIEAEPIILTARV